MTNDCSTERFDVAVVGAGQAGLAIDYAFLPRAELLSFEEITRLARLVAEHGVTNRHTRGGPLVRRDLERLIEMLAAIDGIVDVALTTNGAALAIKARALKDAGLTRVTVSRDSLDDETWSLEVVQSQVRCAWWQRPCIKSSQCRPRTLHSRRWSANGEQVEELLPLSGRCRVLVEAGRHRAGIGAEQSHAVRGVVAPSGQSATSSRSVRSEGGKDRVAAWRKCRTERSEIGVPVRCADHEVKHSPVVPEVVAAAEVPEANIGPDPANALGLSAQRRRGLLQ